MIGQDENVSNDVSGWHGYADANPSEAIQKHELPGLSVAVVFPYKPGLASIGLTSRLGTLNWWKQRDEPDWRAAKAHPHFSLPDWLAAAALAQAHPEEFAASFNKPRHGATAVEGLKALYEAFKRFDLWSATGIAAHLRPTKQLWKVPPEAREFILDRAEGCCDDRDRG